jgi:RNA-binding protein
VTPLSSPQKKYLRSLAHGLKPVVLIGQNGLTPAVMDSIEKALDTHELIKIKFNEFKEKAQKTALTASIQSAAECHLAGIIGHIAIVYRPHRDPEKRTIVIPASGAGQGSNPEG